MLGIAVWEATTSLHPFEKVSKFQMTEYINSRAPQVLAIPDYAPDVLRRVLLRCWARDPKKRPTMKNVVEMLLTWSEPSSGWFGKTVAFMCDLALTTAVGSV